MQLSLATCTAGLFLVMLTKESVAFAPSKLPTATTSSLVTAPLYANLVDDENESNNSSSRSTTNKSLTEVAAKVAPSFLLASFLAVSTVGVSTTAIPAFVEPAHAAIVQQKTAVTAKAAPAATKAKATKKVADTSKIISKEEKELNKAKSNLDLSKSTLKAYEKLSSDAKSANKKALSALETASKDAKNAKKEYVAISDKLSAAKSQKMPKSAIQELSAQSGTGEEKTLQEYLPEYVVINASRFYYGILLDFAEGKQRYLCAIIFSCA